ncbi:chromosomal replication initiator protein DnaA, partial [Treponema pallidum]
FWNETLSQIRSESTEAEFNMWFAHLFFIASFENAIEIAVPSDFFRIQFSQKYQEKLERKFLELSGHPIKLLFAVKKGTPHGNTAPPKHVHTYLEKNSPAEVPSKKSFHPDLNRDYTFENFVSGEETKFSHSAAISVSKNPGTSYNPLLIYGGVGLGKTHLMQAIGHEIYKTTDLNVIYVTAENFGNEFISTLLNKKTQDFKKKYRYTADVLLIDDIHFFENKDGLQEELFYTFNELFEKKKQIIFTCDRPVQELKNLSSRLRSRCSRGLSTDLNMPCFETRCAILIKKIQNYNSTYPHKAIHISDDVVRLVSENISSNIRDLEGALTKIIAFIEVSGSITIDIVPSLLKEFFLSARPKHITVETILHVVADHFNISYSDLKGKKRNKSVVYPRQIAMFLSKELTELSTTELGIEFGGRDHSTVIYGCQKIEGEILTNPSLQANLDLLKSKVQDSIR